MNTIGPIITKYRKDRHLTQAELSEHLKKEGIDVSDKCLHSWEINRTEPGVKQLFTLCKVLGIKDIYKDFFLVFYHFLCELLVFLTNMKKKGIR